MSRPKSFNPLLSQKQGETDVAHTEQALLIVSIRSSHKSKGRPPTAAGTFTFELFQSAPLTKARGDLYQYAV